MEHNLKNITQDFDAICNANGEHIAVGIGAGYDAYETNKANAAHIVRCVNTHDDLVAALDALHKAGEDHMRHVPGDSDFARSNAEFYRALDTARAALAKARGE